MKFRAATSISLDPSTSEEARKWAQEEHLQLSSYIQEAVEMRNKWHQRQKEKETKEANRLTIDEATKKILKLINERKIQNVSEEDLKKAQEIAKTLW